MRWVRIVAGLSWSSALSAARSSISGLLGEEPDVIAPPLWLLADGLQIYAPAKRYSAIYVRIHVPLCVIHVNNVDAMDSRPNNALRFCAACGNLAQVHRPPRADGRVLPARKFCEKHSRVPTGFRRLSKRLFDEVEETAVGRDFLDGDTVRLESALRHFCSEACGVGKARGIIRAPDITAWALRTLGVSAEQAAEHLGVSPRCIRGWRNKVAAAVDRSELLAGCPTAVRDVLLSAALRSDIASLFSAPPLEGISAVSDLINKQHDDSRRSPRPTVVDWDWLIASIEGAGLLTLISPMRMLQVQQNLPTEAFHPAAYLRRLVNRSRLGTPREPGWVLATYKRIAAEHQDGRKDPRDDPAFVLLLGLSLISQKYASGIEIPLAPQGITPVCDWCWRPADRTTGRCPQHRHQKRPPAGHRKFIEFRRALTAAVRQIEPAMRQAPEFSRFNQLVEAEEIRWRETEHRHEIYRSDETSLAFQEASVKFDRLSQTHGLVIDTAAISYVAFHICASGVRSTSLAVSLLIHAPAARRKTTMAQVGRTLGITRQAVQRHMPSASSVFDELMSVINAAVPLPKSVSPREKERVLLQRWALSEAVLKIAVASVTKSTRSKSIAPLTKDQAL